MKKQITHFIGNSIADYDDYCNAVGCCNINDRVLLSDKEISHTDFDEQSLNDGLDGLESWETNYIEQEWGYNDK